MFYCVLYDCLLASIENIMCQYLNIYLVSKCKYLDIVSVALFLKKANLMYHFLIVSNTEFVIT